MIAPTGPRDVRDARRLAELEVTIDRGLASFVEVGEALLEVRDSKLYRIGYDTFEAYLKGRWSLSRSRGYELMQAAEVSAIADIQNAGQARALAPVLRDHGPEVAAVVMAEASADGKPTAEKVRAAAVPFRPRLDPLPDPYFARVGASGLPRTDEEIVRGYDVPANEEGWRDLQNAIHDLRRFTEGEDPADVAHAVPERRRAGTAKTLRQLGTFLGSIALALEEM